MGTQALYALMGSDIEPALREDNFALGVINRASLTLKGSKRMLSSDMLQQKREILFWKSTQTIIINGQEYGELLPDVISSIPAEIYLLPILRTTRDHNDTLGRSRPAWASMDRVTQMKMSKFKYTICGLGLQQSKGSVVAFERLGIFHFGFTPQRFSSKVV